MRRRKRLDASLIHRTTIKVRFSEVDLMQIVWHGEYVKYFEDGREAFGREYVGLGYMDFYQSGYLAPIVDLQVEYKKSLKCNENAIVETRYIDSEAAKIIFEYIIRRETDNEVIATGRTIQVFVDLDGVLMLTPPEFYMKWKEKWITQ